MQLDSVLGIAQSGLASVSRQLGLVGQNVANANSAGYVRETLAATAFSSGQVGMGVRTGVVGRTMDTALQAQAMAAGGEAAGDALRSDALAQVDAASGAPGAGTDLPSLLGNLRDAFSTLLSDPSNTTQQRAVANAASTLAQGINGLAGAIGAVRQSVQDGMGDDVEKANSALRQLGVLSDAIMRAKSRGDSTADLEDKRDAAMDTAAQLTGARFLQAENGDLTAVSGGAILDIRAATGPFSIVPGAVAPGAAPPPLLLNGAPVTLAGGRLGAAQSLGQQELPGLEAGVDDLAQSLLTGFRAAGLTLFTDGGGAVPASAVGLATTIKLSDVVAADPTQVRDGAAGATIAGNTTLINAVLNTVLATGTGTVASDAAALVANHAGLASAAASQLTTQQGVQSSLNAKLSAASGVSVDSELTDMVRLQNSYGANAKVISTLQTMFTQLLEMVR